MLPDVQERFECIAPQVEVSCTTADRTVYVGSEFAPGSCAYREILAHEMRHLKAYLEWLPKVEERAHAPRIALHRQAPVCAPGGARALLQAMSTAAGCPSSRTRWRKVEALQAAIDTPQEYARLSKVCGR
jgi:hypothetical protein